MKIQVLGAGPSGLLAALAILNFGHEPIVYDHSPKKPTPANAGVYFLHADCDMPLRHRDIEIRVLGAESPWFAPSRRYAAKVYGDADQAVSIPDVKVSHERAYDGMQGLAIAWDIVHPFVRKQEIDKIPDDCLVVNTIPLNILYPQEDWKYTTAYIYRGEAPPDESYMLYQANPVVPWYRASAVFGAFTLEYTDSFLPDGKSESKKYVRVRKVINSPEAMPKLDELVLLTGRYGAWDKRKLSHNAYYDTMRWLEKYS